MAKKAKKADQVNADEYGSPIERGPVQMQDFDRSLWREVRKEAKRRGILFKTAVEQSLRDWLRKKP